jgi:sRNA-binding regulator protein Hfq
LKERPDSRKFKKGPSREGPPRGRRPLGAPPPGSAPDASRQQGPADHTLQEAKYLKSLVVNKTPVRVRLRNSEEVQGVVEYYDANFIRLTRSGEANLFIYKSDIKYLEEQA